MMEGVMRLASFQVRNTTLTMNTFIACNVPSKINSRGLIVGRGASPMNFYLPLIMIQAIAAFGVNRLVVYLLKPLPTPIVVSEIIAGISFSPTLLNHYKGLKETLIPIRGIPLVWILSDIGIFFFLFKVGIQTDLPLMIRSTGRKPIIIAAVVVAFTSIANNLYFVLSPFPDTSFHNPLIFYLGQFSTLTNFPVVATLFTELKLLNSELGKLCLSATMAIDIFGWVMRICSSIWSQESFWIILLVIASYIIVYVVLVYVLQPVMLSIVRRTPKGRAVDEFYIVVIFAGVLASGLFSDMMGAGRIAGPFVFGLVVPSGPPLGSALIERMESMTQGLFLPLFYLLSGFKILFPTLKNFTGWNYVGFLVTGWVGKMIGTLLPCWYYNMSLQDSFMMGLVMNTEGMIEMVMMNQRWLLKIIDDQLFFILVVWVILTACMSSIVIKLWYDPVRHRHAADHQRTLENAHPKSNLGILICFHDSHNVSTLVNLIQLTHPTKETPISLYPLQLLELTAQAAPLLVSHGAAPSRNRRNPKPNTSSIFNAFYNCAACGNVNLWVEPFTAVAPLATIDQDIHSLAVTKKVSLVILPFHMQQTITGHMEETNKAFRAVNQNFLNHGPCSIGILIDRGIRGTTLPSSNAMYEVGVIFIGGRDDREAVAYVARMAQHPRVHVTILRLARPDGNAFDGDHDKLMVSVVDEAFLNDFQKDHSHGEGIDFKEKVVMSVEATVAAIKEMGKTCHLLVVGQGSGKGSPLVAGLQGWTEYTELGTIGDLLGPSDSKVTASVLVVQQHGSSNGKELEIYLARLNSEKNKRDSISTSENLIRK